MANIAGSYDQNAEPQGDFSPIPAGDYRAVIEDSDIENISPKQAKGRCMKLAWKVDGGEFNGRLVWQRLNLWPENMNNMDKVVNIANGQFASIRAATGIPAPNDTKDLHHRPCIIRVALVSDPNGKYADKNEVKNVLPIGQQASGSSAPSAPPAPPQGQTMQQMPPQQQNGGGGQQAPWPRSTA